MTYNADSELTSSGKAKKATTYTYDAEGERTATVPKKGTATTYSYNQAGELTGFTKGTTKATYAYNGDGLRMAKTVGTTSTPFTWDTAASTPLLLFDGTTSYLYGPGGLPLEQITGPTPVFLYHDQLGLHHPAHERHGQEVVHLHLDSYGALKSKTGKVTTPLLYAGQYRDAESGLYYLRARYYDPTTGQFLSVDPLLSITGQPYFYAEDDPLNSEDPSGLWVLGTCIAYSAAFDVITSSGAACYFRTTTWDSSPVYVPLPANVALGLGLSGFAGVETIASNAANAETLANAVESGDCGSASPGADLHLGLFGGGGSLCPGGIWLAELDTGPQAGASITYPEDAEPFNTLNTQVSPSPCPPDPAYDVS